MKLPRSIRRLRRVRRRAQRPAFARASDEIRARTKAFIAATSFESRTASFGRLFRTLWTGPGERAFTVRLIRWVRLLEHDELLRIEFQRTFQSMLAGLNSISLFAEAGLPAHHAVFSEGMRRIFQRILPSARAESDSSRLLVSLFSSSRDVERFLNLPDYLFERLSSALWPPPVEQAGAPKATGRVMSDLRQALCLIAARTAGRGLTPAMRERGRGFPVEESPFYRLVFLTNELARAGASTAAPRFDEWKSCARNCREEISAVYLRMEDSGVSADLMLDLGSIELALTRMGRLAELLASSASSSFKNSESGISEMERSESRVAARRLLDDLVQGRLEDKRLRSLLKQNLNLLARKTVEHTGHSGEHYIAHTNREYWQMWASAFGGGLLTVFTAAIKMRIVEQHAPLFVEGFLSSANYAISFILLQVFGLTLATKQPSATAATFAGIVRKNRGYARSQSVADFTARITRTQLAAALANVIAVCLGCVALERLWRVMFSESYLPAESARHVYETLHPLASGTIFFAAGTGVLLWMAALIGGWCENFAVYHRVPAAVQQHPFGIRVGEGGMRRLANSIELNLAGWSTSIALGALLGFAPVIARFFGVPFDVRHVTLSTGTFALAAARYGTGAFGHDWFYYAAAGIGVTFFLNLGVSFLIAAFVALRAYAVPAKEQWGLLRFLAGQMVRSPLKFLIPVGDEPAPALSTPVEEE
jgi:site-specific recombinase